MACRDDREREVVGVWRNGGLGEGSIVTYLQWCRLFRSYCAQRGLDEMSQLTLNRAIGFASDYVGPRTRGPVATKTRLMALTALHAWSCALASLKVPVPRWRREPAPLRLSPLLVAYADYRRSQCGVSEVTLRRDRKTVNAFLSSLHSRGKAVTNATVADVDAFIMQLSRCVSKRTVADACSSLRAFLRFLRTTGKLRRDLASLVTAPRIRFLERPPRTLSWEQVRRILKSIPQTEPTGRRDFALLLLMATYGLGAAEVLGLCLEDVDWEREILTVCRPKTGVATDLPLLPPIARALAAYIQKDRPRHAEARRVFLRRRMPHDSLTGGAIRHQIRHYARRAGITAGVIGAHAFRRSYASRQVDAGADLQVLSDILGHRRPSSTSVYVRVALRRLRTVALPVPR